MENLCVAFHAEHLILIISVELYHGLLAIYQMLIGLILLKTSLKGLFLSLMTKEDQALTFSLRHTTCMSTLIANLHLIYINYHTSVIELPNIMFNTCSHMGSNKLTGTIPEELFNSSMHLKHL